MHQAGLGIIGKSHKRFGKSGKELQSLSELSCIREKCPVPCTLSIHVSRCGLHQEKDDLGQVSLLLGDPRGLAAVANFFGGSLKMESKWNSLLLYLSQPHRGEFGTSLFLNNLFIFSYCFNLVLSFYLCLFCFSITLFQYLLVSLQQFEHTYTCFCVLSHPGSLCVYYIFLQVFKQLTYKISSISSFVNKFPNILIFKHILTVSLAPTSQDWDRPIFQLFSLSSICTKCPVNNWILFQFFSWLLP